ncbi:MAG: DUF1552 domain-containing protein [Myxococcota bacterium]
MIGRNTHNRRFPRRRGLAMPRRRFLQGVAAAGALGPLVPLLHSEAADGEFPCRLILLFSPNGSLQEQWEPTGTGTDFTLSEILEPLEPHRDSLNIVSGLRMRTQGPGGAHRRGIGHLWTGAPLLEGNEFPSNNGNTGWGSGTSVDQFLVQQLQPDTVYPSLEFGVQTNDHDVNSRMIYAGSAQPVAPEDSPQAMFERLFADFGVDTGTLDRIRAERHSVIDSVKADLDRIKTRAGQEDRERMELHLQSIREIEVRIDAEIPACVPPDGTHMGNHMGNAAFPAVSAAMIDQMVAALACDLTRFASLQWSQSVSQTRFEWLGIDEGHHSISHYGNSNESMVTNITAINRWYAGQLAYLLERLAAVPEGDGTMLDNTLVVWGNELARGNNHSHDPMPFVLAGGASGQIETGRVLRFDDGSSHNRLLVSLCHLMGANDVETYGATDNGSGGLDGLT